MSEVAFLDVSDVATQGDSHEVAGQSDRPFGSEKGVVSLPGAIGAVGSLVGTVVTVLAALFVAMIEWLTTHGHASFVKVRGMRVREAKNSSRGVATEVMVLLCMRSICILVAQLRASGAFPNPNKVDAHVSVDCAMATAFKALFRLQNLGNLQSCSMSNWQEDAVGCQT